MVIHHNLLLLELRTFYTGHFAIVFLATAKYFTGSRASNCLWLCLNLLQIITPQLFVRNRIDAIFEFGSFKIIV